MYIQRYGLHPNTHILLSSVGLQECIEVSLGASCIFTSSEERDKIRLVGFAAFPVMVKSWYLLMT